MSVETQSFLLAFVFTPLFVVFLGYVAVRLHERDMDRRDREEARKRAAD